ncbi:MAG: hypothetical protein AAGJ28_26510 [Pseudomonadota bacterium]
MKVFLTHFAFFSVCHLCFAAEEVWGIIGTHQRFDFTIKFWAVFGPPIAFAQTYFFMRRNRNAEEAQTPDTPTRAEINLAARTLLRAQEVPARMSPELRNKIQRVLIDIGRNRLEEIAKHTEY